MTDSAIIALLRKSHTDEIAAGGLAATKGTSERVRKYGEELKTDHTKALQELEAYVQRMNPRGSSANGIGSGIVGDSTMKRDGSNTGRDNSAMSGRRDSMSIVGRDTSPVRDSASTGRDPNAVAGRRDSSRMVQSELPPGKDSVGARHDSVLAGRDTMLVGTMSRDSVHPSRENGVTASVGGQQGYPAGQDSSARGLESLQSLSGAEFDQAFIHLEVEHHQEELSHLRSNVIPLIRDSGLRSLVQGSLTAMGKHLRDGQAVEQYLKTK
ncbi:MAG: DUF4142 domain-containing protein [Gemmatimonadota bacterium]